MGRDPVASRAQRCYNSAMDDNQLKLNRDQRRRLIEILNKLIVTSTASGRSLLLRDLPPTLQSLLPQGDVQRVQIEMMVRAVEDWGGAVDGTPTLLVLIENALDLS